MARHRRRRQHHHRWVDLTLDTTPPPAPVLIEAPSDPSGSSARFDFASAEPGTECRLDSGAWTTCTAPVSLRRTPGRLARSVSAHRFRRKCRRDRRPHVDGRRGRARHHLQLPERRTRLQRHHIRGWLQDPVGDLCGTASDAQGSIAGVAVSIQQTSTSLFWNGNGIRQRHRGLPRGRRHDVLVVRLAPASFPAEGGYAVRARATDNVRLTGFDSVTITIDRTAPAVPAITGGPIGTTAGGDTFSFTGEPGAGFECRLDAGSWSACASPRTLGALSDGSHTFTVVGSTPPETSAA